MLVEPPRNGGYLVAAYIITTTILVVYWIRLWRMSRRTQQRERQLQKRDGF